MKSLKRTLSLVLALVMVLGLFGGLSMTASASGFSDDADVQYNEAVDVMTGIGAINGVGGNLFKPKSDITRAEAAKMVAYTVLGAETAKGLSGVTTQFSDVPASKYDWAIPSIEYLTNKGVINGMGDGTFKPEDPVTGYEVAKMLLCALGYGQDKEFVGKGWDLQVAVYGTQKGILKGRADDANAMDDPASREEVALYCFNAIQSPLVEYLDTLNIYRDQTTTNGAGGGGRTVPATLKNTVYYPDLDLDTNAATKFLEPAHEWSFKNKVVGTYADPADFTYTTLKTAADKTAMNRELRDIKISGSSNVDVTKNGYNNNGNGRLSSGASVADAVDLIVDTPLTGNGTVVEVYLNDSTGEVSEIVRIMSEVAEVSFIDPSSGAVTLKVESENPVKGSATSYTVPKDSSLYSAVANLKLEDRVIVVPLFDGTDCTPYSITPTTKVEGKVDSSTVSGGNATSYTVDGKKYAVAACATEEAFDGPDDSAGAGVVDTVENGTVWLDSNGYVVDYEPAQTATPSNIFKVMEQYQTLADKKIVNMATLAKTDGTVIDVPIKGVSVTNGDIVTATTTSMEEGVYDLAKVTGSANELDAVTGTIAAGTLAGHNKAIKLKGAINASDRTLTPASSGNNSNYGYANYYADGTNVKFIYYKTISGTTPSYEVVKVLEGVQKVTNASGCIAIVETRSAVTDSIPSIDGKAEVVTAVFLPIEKLEGAVDTSNLLLAVSGSPVGTDGRLNTNSGKNETINRYAFYANGEKVEYNIKGSVLPETGHFYTMSSDANVEKTYNLQAFTPTGTSASIENGVVTEGQDNVIKVDDGTGTIKVIDISKASIVDVRASKSPALSATPQGIINQIKNVANSIDASVLYDSSTGYASAVYITNVSATERAKVAALTIDPAAGKRVDGDTYSITVDKLYVAAGDTVTLTVTTTAKDSTDDTDDTITVTSTAGMTLTTPALTKVGGSSRFTVKSGVAANNAIAVERSSPTVITEGDTAQFKFTVTTITGAATDVALKAAIA